MKKRRKILLRHNRRDNRIIYIEREREHTHTHIQFGIHPHTHTHTYMCVS